VANAAIPDSTSLRVSITSITDSFSSRIDNTSAWMMYCGDTRLTKHPKPGLISIRFSTAIICSASRMPVRLTPKYSTNSFCEGSLLPDLKVPSFNQPISWSSVWVERLSRGAAERWL
jgi:hypothetical protein